MQPDLFTYKPPHATYPHTAGHRGADTSIEVAAKIDSKPNRKEQCYRDIEAVLLQRGGATTSELVELLDYDYAFIQPRTTELFKLGRIFYQGERRPNKKGNNERVWVI